MERLSQLFEGVRLRIKPRFLGLKALDALVVEVGGFSQFLLSKTMFCSQFSYSIGYLLADISCHDLKYGNETAQLTPHGCPIVRYTF
jgi:hypothetical protein